MSQEKATQQKASPEQAKLSQKVQQDLKVLMHPKKVNLVMKILMSLPPNMGGQWEPTQAKMDPLVSF